MAFIYDKDPRVKAVREQAYSTQQKRMAALDYPQLVKLYRDSKKDPAAALEFDRLPPGEQRLAKQITKAYTPKQSKPKLTKAEKKLRKAAKAGKPVTMAQRVFSMWGESPDPVIREAARKIAGKL